VYTQCSKVIHISNCSVHLD